MSPGYLRQLHRRAGLAVADYLAELRDRPAHFSRAAETALPSVMLAVNVPPSDYDEREFREVPPVTSPDTVRARYARDWLEAATTLSLGHPIWQHLRTLIGETDHFAPAA